MPNPFKKLGVADQMYEFRKDVSRSHSASLGDNGPSVEMLIQKSYQHSATPKICPLLDL